MLDDQYIATIRGAFQQIELREVWRDLTTKGSLVAGSAHSERHCYLALRPHGNAYPQAARNRLGQVASARQREVIERLLLGDSQKVVAFELGIAPCTVALSFSKVMRELGMTCRLQNVPLLLAMAAHAAHGSTRFRTAEELHVTSAGAHYRIVRCSRPDLWLSARLSPEQYSVVRLMLEGKTQRAIAAFRGRSVRTVANQLGHAYTKLGVSGRLDLVRWLLHASGATRAA